jgi:hypothetical protein
MMSKPTTPSDAGLSIAAVRPDTGVRRNTVCSLRQHCGFRHFAGGSLGNGSNRVKQAQRLELNNGLPDAGMHPGMGVGMAHLAFRASLAALEC